MKSVRRATRKANAEVQETIAKQNDKEAQKQKMAKLADKELFSVNVDKSQLARRPKLAADRFKAKEQKGKSKVEQEILKKMARNPTQSKPAQKSEFADIWADNTTENKWKTQFKAFTKQQVTKVKAIVPPMAGHSFNPSAQAHTQVLKKVLDEEQRQIEEEMRTIKQQGYEQKAETHQDHISASESEDNYDVMEVPNKAVDREKRKTKAVRNKQVENREKQDEL